MQHISDILIECLKPIEYNGELVAIWLTAKLTKFDANHTKETTKRITAGDFIRIDEGGEIKDCAVFADVTHKSIATFGKVSSDVRIFVEEIKTGNQSFLKI